MIVFLSVLENYLNNDTKLHYPIFHRTLQTAVSQQLDLGLECIPQAFLVKGWMSAIEATGVQNPERRMDALQLMLWDDVVTPLWLWTQRNATLHDTKN